MIKNIVFDMGKVLLNYDSKRVCSHFISDEAEQKEVDASVFNSAEWIMLDMGIISEEDALVRMQNRLSSDHAKEMARLCMEHWHEHCMWEKEGMRDLVKELKEKGYGIYLCSNASIRLLSIYQDVIPGIEYFDGVLFSADVKYIKPQKEIYTHLFERFQLDPQECFFIDDLQANIDGGKACGMDGYCFVDGDVEKLKQVLNQIKE